MFISPVTCLSLDRFRMNVATGGFVDAVMRNQLPSGHPYTEAETFYGLAELGTVESPCPLVIVIQLAFSNLGYS